VVEDVKAFEDIFDALIWGESPNVEDVNRISVLDDLVDLFVTRTIPSLRVYRQIEHIDVESECSQLIGVKRRVSPQTVRESAQHRELS
jgi:hypothetical protein